MEVFDLCQGVDQFFRDAVAEIFLIFLGAQIRKRKHGYVVVTPLGYTSTGGYGQRIAQTFNPAGRREMEWSEKDVMNVVDLVMKEYRIDGDLICLMGHSMGGDGTWHLGAKYADRWAGLAPIASGMGIDRQDLEKIRNIPVLVSHGDANVVALPAASRRAAEEMKRLGMIYEYFELSGATHGSIVSPAFEKVFSFFDAHRKKK